LNGEICCLLKLFLNKLDIDIDTKQKSIKKFKKEYSFDKLIQTIDAFRSILVFTFQDEEKMLKKTEFVLKKMITAPVKLLLQKLTAKLREIESNVVSKIESFFSDQLDQDHQNPDNILDCLYFEGFSDFIYDGIEDIFEDIENYLVDIYKFVFQQIDLYEEDSVHLGRKKQIKQVYDVLTKLSNSLNVIDEFSLKEGIEEYVQSFLIKSGYGTTYNSITGRMEPVSFDTCLDSTANDGSYKSFLPENKKEVAEIDLENNKEFQNFNKNYEPINFDCSLDQPTDKEIDTLKNEVQEKINTAKETLETN
jgi:hypothetical protein